MRLITRHYHHAGLKSYPTHQNIIETNFISLVPPTPVRRTAPSLRPAPARRPPATARSHRSAPPAAAQPPRAVPRAASRRRERSVAARPAPPAVAVAAVAALRLAVALRDPLALRSFLLVFVVRGLVRFTFSHEGAGSQADKWCGGSNLNRRIPSEPGPKPGAIGHAMRPPRHRVTAQRIY